MEKTWWKNAVGYQIYPKSFYDTNGDGVGDLKGIIAKLDYIKDLGINLIWIGPFYKSPMDDNGYDVSDFFDVDPLFGTLQDAKDLIAEAHKRGIKIILDLVLNHTSDEHPWFIESRSSLTNPKREYYIWQDGKKDVHGHLHAPTNWGSFFEGSAWNLDPITHQYYMKIFSDKMPDLNWASPALREEMFKMARWWLDQGIDGFRVDAIAHLARDLSFTDSTMPLNSHHVAPDWGKFSNRPELFDYLKEFNEKVLRHYDCMTVGEVGGGASVDAGVKYAGYDSHIFNMVFNFDTCWKNNIFGNDNLKDEDIKIDVLDMKKTFDKWIQGMKGKGWMPHYWLNHDHPRVMSQYGDPKHFHRESGTMLGTILLTLPGTPFIYNGEEIGMTNVDYTSIDDFTDVWVKNYYKQAIKHLTKEQILSHLRRTSRNNARTPMQWNDQAYAGFSTHEPHQKNVGNYPLINVEKQQAEKDSILNTYKFLIRLRKESRYAETLIYGDFKLIHPKDPDVFAYTRTLYNQQIMVICNFSKEAQDFTLPQRYKHVIFNNYQNAHIHKVLHLKPYEAMIVEV
jgi:glycosidase